VLPPSTTTRTKATTKTHETEENQMTTQTREFGLTEIPLVPSAGIDAEPTTIRVPVEIVAPGIGITPQVDIHPTDGMFFSGGWFLTHLPSGMNLNGGVDGQCLTCVRDYAKAAVESGIDFTVAQPELTDLVRNPTPAVNLFRDAQMELHCCGGIDCHGDDEDVYVD